MTSTTTVTVLFTDVVGNTALRQRLGDAAAERLLQDHNKLVRDQIGPCGGREVKIIGDSFMVAFDSARKAVDCAIAIQRALADRSRGSADEPLRVRIGVNTGEATKEKGDLSGTAVNAAKYIEGKAQPDQVLVSETVKALIGPVKDLTFADRGRFRLKGFPERWHLYEVVWKEEATAAPAYLEQTPFVGRETELAELRRLLEGTLRGQGALAMIGGEPGVGKTRLAVELMTEARQRGVLAWSGRCYEMEGAPSYVPFVEILEKAVRVVPQPALREALGDWAPDVAKLMPELRRLFPDITVPPDLPPEQERRYLFNGIRDFLARASRVQPMVLVLDDLHWADDSTMLLLQHIAQQLNEMPLLMVGTYRDVDLAVARPLARTLEELLRRRLAHDMILTRMPEAAVAAMLGALAGQAPPAALVNAVYRETEGNPFFVEEVFKHLSEVGRLFDARGRWRSDLSIGELDVPRGVRLVIERRLLRVSEECRRLLTAAAVIGRAFSFQLLHAVGEVDPEVLLDAVDEAERARLITSTVTGPVEQFTFVHELIRQTLVSGIAGPRRQQLHLRILEAIERVYGDAADQHAAEIFHHLDGAGAAADPAQIGHYLGLAGQQAARAAAIRDDVELYDKALSVWPADLRCRADLLYYRGEALRRMGHWKSALADWEEALATFEELGETKAVARVAAAMADHLTWAEDRWQEAAVFAKRGWVALGKRAKAGRLRRLAQATGTLLKRPLKLFTRQEANDNKGGRP